VSTFVISTTCQIDICLYNLTLFSIIYPSGTSFHLACLSLRPRLTHSASVIWTLTALLAQENQLKFPQRVAKLSATGRSRHIFRV